MSNQQQQYLKEMGIQTWELIHPERLAGYQSQKEILDSACKLLLVSSDFPTSAEITLFEKVLKSFHVKLDQAQYVSQNNLPNLDISSVEWIWYAGCDGETPSGIKVLHTPLLSEIDGNTQHRRDLWQQICSYEA